MIIYAKYLRVSRPSTKHQTTFRSELRRRSLLNDKNEEKLVAYLLIRLFGFFGFFSFPLFAS